MKRDVDLRFVIGPLLGLLAAGAFAAQGCWNSYGIVGSNCPSSEDGEILVPLECCPCPIPEECPGGPKPIPTYCCEKWPDLAKNQGWTDGGGCIDDDGGVQPPDGGTSILCPESSRCLPPAPGFIGPEFVYQGSAIGALACPPVTPELTFNGVADPAAFPPPPADCTQCACDAPEGTCNVPLTWTVSSAACDKPAGGIKLPLDPPPDWDGSCLADKTIPEGALCAGKPCVSSLIVSAPVLTETPCTPRALAPAPGPVGLKGDGPLPETTIADACAPPMPWPVCQGEEQKTCVPRADNGFHTCMRKAGDVACPEGWPVRALFYDEVADKRTCTECTCGPSSGGVCLASISLASDATCSGLPLQGVMVTSIKSTSCHDLPPGVAVGSKAAEVISYEPGACEPLGGDAEGEIVTAGPMTICCLEDG